MARSFASTGHFLIRGAHANYGFVYPLLISPAYALFSPISEVYRWVRVIDALAMCSVVLPAYLLARRVLKLPSALAVAALAVAVPSMAYVGTVMTENVFYPIFVWLMFALVCALERPTLRRQLVVLALCALAFVTRAQTVALVVAVLSAPLVLAWIERGRPRRLSAFRPLYGTVGLVALLVVVVEVVRGRSPAQVLGNYSVTSNGGYHVWPVLKWIVLHVAELDLSLWILPFAALIVLVANARHLDRPLRVFVAATTSVSVWLLLEVGAFASQYSQRIEERNLFYVTPLFVIALLAWIERGQPKPPNATVVAAVLAAALPGAIPFAEPAEHQLPVGHDRSAAMVVRRRRVGRSHERRRGRGARLDRARSCVPLAAAPLRACAAGARRPGLPRDVAAGRAVAALVPAALPERVRPGRSERARAGSTAPSGRNAHVAVLWSGGNRYARLAERVLEPQHRPRLQPRLDDVGRPARGRRVDRPWRPGDRHPARPQGPRASRSVRAHEQRRQPSSVTESPPTRRRSSSSTASPCPCG